MIKRRPWLRLYDEGLPAELAPPFPDALSMFRALVADHPAHPLVYYFDTAMTSADIDRLSDALAVGLSAEHGVTRGDRVALYLQNVPQFIISLLASWKLGAIAVPINPMLRERELGHLLADSGARALIALESLGETASQVLPSTDVTVFMTTSELDFLDRPPPSLANSRRTPIGGARDLLAVIETHDGQSPPPIVIDPEDIAVLTYTSGTTGPPKGAMNLHRNIVYASETFRRWRYMGRDDVILGLSPLFHATGLVCHIALSFASGAPLVLFYRFDPGTALELVERYRATFTAGAITAFIAMLADEERAKRDISSLRKIISGGAPIPPSVVEEFERNTGVYVYNGYGMTEATGPLHQLPVSRRAPVDPASGALSIGVPVFGTESRVVDDGGHEVATGEIGEIVVAGPQVVPGYWHQPEETALAFVDGMLRTGDVGFMDDDGFFYLVDRKKDMINAAGFKVWPREVEDVLYEHEAVLEAAVVGVPDSYRGETVKAFVTLRGDAQAQPEDLINFCRERMAAYKYPRSVEIVTDLPKSASGKILRRELRSA